MEQHRDHEMTAISPESIVKERLDYVVREIFQFTFPSITSDTILWRDKNGLHKMRLTEESPLVIGRAPECGLVLSDPFLSRQHATIRKKENEWFLFDRGSRNGTWVNNHPVDAASLQSGDIIKIGNTTFVFMRATIADYETEMKAFVWDN